MYEFLSQNELYIVLIVALICWLGIFGYLFRLDRKVLSLENKLKEEKVK